ncbi:MAG: hypothetical protein PF637_06070 [Spirochaetes bacterium]|nr:hypothetical protein [Spirochaetota bacterium]
MNRWDRVKPVEIDGKEVKLYRPPFEAEMSITIDAPDIELDHLSHIHLGTSQEMYKIIDANLESFIDSRGEVKHMGKINIPVIEKVYIDV